MSGYFRLRQICLVAPELERAVADIETIFGVRTCFRDPAVGKYGLANALFPFGETFLEIVTPTRLDTAAGRFLERSSGIGGYMAIFSCDDVERRGAHAQKLGITIAHKMDYDSFFGIQLHPRDCRAAMIEFDRTQDGADPRGPYHPAGHDWQNFVKTDVTRTIAAIGIESPRPQDIAMHWSAILEQPLEGKMTIPTEMIDIRFVQAAPDARETLRTIHLDVADARHIRQGAEARGHVVEDGVFEMYGVRFVMEF